MECVSNDTFSQKLLCPPKFRVFAENRKNLNLKLGGFFERKHFQNVSLAISESGTFAKSGQLCFWRLWRLCRKPQWSPRATARILFYVFDVAWRWRDNNVLLSPTSFEGYRAWTRLKVINEHFERDSTHIYIIFILMLQYRLLVLQFFVFGWLWIFLVSWLLFVSNFWLHFEH